MDLVKLHDTTSQPERLVEKYHSLIWTERYLDPGDFQLKTYDIADTRLLLPLDSIVSHLESREVMIVETHLIEKDADGRLELTITGRTYETILEQRAAIPNMYGYYPPTAPWFNDTYNVWETPSAMTTAVTAQYIIDYIMDGGANINDLMPVAAIDYTDIITPSKRWVIERGDLYSQVIALLESERLGIKTIRPDPTYGGIIMGIHNGYNRSEGNSDLTKRVTFDTEAGHFVSESYLFSKKNYKNVCYAFTNLSSETVTAPGVPSNVSGRSRRVLYLDCNDIQNTTTPDWTLAGHRGSAELAKLRRTIFFDGEVSPDVPWKYGTHYNIGDIVRIKGDYGVDQDVRVDEHTRTEDHEGERSYPTLSEI